MAEAEEVGETEQDRKVEGEVRKSRMAEAEEVGETEQDRKVEGEVRKSRMAEAEEVGETEQDRKVEGEVRKSSMAEAEEVGETEQDRKVEGEVRKSRMAEAEEMERDGKVEGEVRKSRMAEAEEVGETEQDQKVEGEVRKSGMAEAEEIGETEQDQKVAGEVDSNCSHYLRGCSFVAPCCDKEYKCRVCHDEEEFHKINRFKVKEVICRSCSTRQPATNLCVNCKAQFGKYFCSICHMYDNTEKGQFHCQHCGICRVGGADKFYHCHNCGLCIAVTSRESHTCRAGMSKDNCPVCMEDIHSSRDPAHIPPCGHLLHWKCYQELIQTTYRCPQCQTSLSDMKPLWDSYDNELRAWPMPDHLQDFKVKISCRDCHKESLTVFHVVGLKCMECGAYNTVRIGDEEIPPDAVPVRAQEYLRRQEERRRQRELEERNEEQNEEPESQDGDDINDNMDVEND